MDIYWICSECGTANQYPKNKHCDVCDKEIDSNEIRQAETKLRTIKKQEHKDRIIEYQAKRNAIKQEQLLKRREKTELRRKQRAQKAQIYQERNKKALIYFQKGLKATKICLILLVIASLVVVSVSIVKNGNTQLISNVLKSKTQNIIQQFSKNHFVITNGKELFKPLYNIKLQIDYLSKQLRESENIKQLFDLLGW